VQIVNGEQILIFHMPVIGDVSGLQDYTGQNLFLDERPYSYKYTAAFLTPSHYDGDPQNYQQHISSCMVCASMSIGLKTLMDK